MKLNLKGITVALVFAGVLTAGATALAQSIKEIVPTEVEVAKEFADNFKANVKVGATLNFTNNYQFVGQAEGNAVNFGSNVEAGYLLLRSGHDWRSQLKLLLSFTYGPPLERLMKSNDQFYFDTIYFYHPKGYEWIGPFARFTMESSMLDGQNNTEGFNDYVDGNGTVVKAASDRFTLTKSFSPITFKEAAGIYARPISKPEIEIIITFGFGAAQVAMSGDQYTLGAYAAPTVVGGPGTYTINKLDPYEQVGIAGGLKLSGTYDSKVKIIYGAFCEFMVPMYPDLPAGKNYGDMTNVDIGANMSLKVFSWATLDYVLKVVRQPQLLEGWQVQNMLMVTIGYSWDYDEIAAAAKKAEVEKAEAEAVRVAADAAAATN